MSRRRGNPGLKGRLLDKSVEAYILSLETINRLSVKYRIENFSHLICNAWELLLKAKILDNSKDRKSIYYKTEKGQRPRTLSLRDCVQKIFPNEKDPVRRNLEHVCSLRDEATHLILSQVPKDILALFQSCVLNYHKRLVEWFNISISNRVSVGMMTIVYDFSPEEFGLQSPVLRRRLGRETAQYLAKVQEEIRQEFENLGRPAEFSIDIDYKLTLVKKPDIADIVLSSGSSGAPIGIVEVPKDPSKTHPHRQKEIIATVNAALDGANSINQHDIQCIIKIYEVRKRPEFYYKGTVQGSPSQYSDAFVEWLVRQYGNDNAFFTKARQKVKST
jgi:hypothetical protein